MTAEKAGKILAHGIVWPAMGVGARVLLVWFHRLVHWLDGMMPL